jgi:hypothetical protein
MPAGKLVGIDRTVPEAQGVELLLHRVEDQERRPPEMRRSAPRPHDVGRRVGIARRVSLAEAAGHAVNSLSRTKGIMGPGRVTARLSGPPGLEKNPSASSAAAGDLPRFSQPEGNPR